MLLENGNKMVEEVWVLLEKVKKYSEKGPIKVVLQNSIFEVLVTASAASLAFQFRVESFCFRHQVYGMLYWHWDLRFSPQIAKLELSKQGIYECLCAICILQQIAIIKSNKTGLVCIGHSPAGSTPLNINRVFVLITHEIVLATGIKHFFMSQLVTSSSLLLPPTNNSILEVSK